MSRDDYSQRQKARDTEYQREYKAWIKSLPPAERRKLEAQGLAEPDVAHHGNGSAWGDAADSPVMRIGDDPALVPEAELETVLPPQPEPSQTHAPDTELNRFETLWRALGGPELDRESRFHPTRRWRADFAHLTSRTLIEIEGGIYVNGRHNRGAGFAADLEKYLEAALTDWRVMTLAYWFELLPWSSQRNGS